MCNQINDLNKSDDKCKSKKDEKRIIILVC